MLTDAQLTSMRSVAEDALPGTAVIYGGTFASDGGGGGSFAYTASGTVSCRIAPLTGTEREVGERISSDADFIVTLPVSTSVSTDSRLVISGGTFNVAAIRDRDWEITQRVEVVKQT
jgi:head-tail adaptor